MLSLKKLLKKILTGVPQQKFGTSTSSFSAAMPSNPRYPNTLYIKTVLDSLDANIGNYSTGMHAINSTAGPQYGVVLYKLNASYYAGLILFYQRDADLIYFKRDNAGYHIYLSVPSIVGGVLRNPVIARLSAISGIGGGVNELKHEEGFGEAVKAHNIQDRRIKLHLSDCGCGCDRLGLRTTSRRCESDLLFGALYNRLHEKLCPAYLFNWVTVRLFSDNEYRYSRRDLSDENALALHRRVAISERRWAV